MPRPVTARTATMVRTVAVSAFGLLPVGIVSAMMLMQILGIWSY